MNYYSVLFIRLCSLTKINAVDNAIERTQLFYKKNGNNLNQEPTSFVFLLYTLTSSTNLNDVNKQNSQTLIITIQFYTIKRLYMKMGL